MTNRRPFLLAAFAVLATILFLKQDFLLSGLGSALHYGVEMQRSFNRDLAHHLRAVKEGTDPHALWLSLGLAFGYGVVHALGPGHGKFVVTTYFLAHRRRVWRGFLMGTQIAVMHVISAIIIVLIAHFLATRMWGPTGDMPALRTASYASIAAVGGYMLWRALRHGGHHDRSPDENGRCGHDHGDSGKQGLLSLTVGIAPCSGAVLLLIYAFANDVVPLGILMVAAIAAGMAITMIALGLLAIFARRTIMRRLELRRSDAADRITLLIELGGAALIILFGTAMTVTSVWA